jgi:DNA primase
VDQLNRRFRGVPSPMRPGPAPTNANAATGGASGENGANGRPAPRRPLNAQDRAERWILGSLLLDPPLWTKLQRVVGVIDFANPVARRLAEMYWAYQRDEGEPVFNEFLGLLGDPERGGHNSLQEFAVEAVDEVEALASTPGADPKETLAEAVAHVERTRRLREQQKLFAELRRTDTTAGGDDPNNPDVRTSEQNEQHEIDQLRRLQEMARRPDLRRS